MPIEEYRSTKPVILTFGTRPGPEVGETKDIQIPVTGASIPARIYYPKRSHSDDATQLPCYVNYHGGGVCPVLLPFHSRVWVH